MYSRESKQTERGRQMKRKLWAVGQEQASSLPTRLHTPLHRGFPTACHWRDWSLQGGREGGIRLVESGVLLKTQVVAHAAI